MKNELTPGIRRRRVTLPGNGRAAYASLMTTGFRPELPVGLEAPCLAVPVDSEIPEANAVVLFGPHLSGNDLDDDEVELLQKLARRAAAGYERVVTRLLREEVGTLKSKLAALQSANQSEGTTS